MWLNANNNKKDNNNTSTERCSVRDQLGPDSLGGASRAPTHQLQPPLRRGESLKDPTIPADAEASRPPPQRAALQSYRPLAAAHAAALSPPLPAARSASSSGIFPVYTPSTVRPVTPSLRPPRSAAQSRFAGAAPSGCGRRRTDEAGRLG